MLTSWNRLPAGQRRTGDVFRTLLIESMARSGNPSIRGESAGTDASGFDHEQKGLGRRAGGGIQHAKPVATRRARLDIGGEPAAEPPRPPEGLPSGQAGRLRWETPLLPLPLPVPAETASGALTAVPQMSQ